MKGTPIVTLRLKPLYREQMERIAARLGVSLSETIREAVAEYIEAHCVDDE